MPIPLFHCDTGLCTFLWFANISSTPSRQRTLASTANLLRDNLSAQLSAGIVKSVDGPKYGLTVGWTEASFAHTNSRYPFCIGESMRTGQEGFYQDLDKWWLFGNFSFSGVGLSLLGVVDFMSFPLNRSLTYSIDTIGSTIDGGEIQLHNLTTPYLAHIYEFYTTGPLPDGQHLLNLTQIPPGVAWDWAAITPGPDMPIKGETLLVDDTDEVIIYTGNWEQTREPFLVGGVPKAQNFIYYHSGYGGGVHVARTVNDTLQFPFTGTSVSVFGFFRWDVPGSISAIFQIDDMQADRLSFPKKPDSVTQNQTAFQVHTEPNFMFYTSPPIEAGDHILMIKITEVTEEQSLIIDTLQYHASFDTLSSMPRITFPTLNPKPVSPGSFPQSARTGAIVGGIVGGVLILVILVLIGIWLHRRKFRRDEKPPPALEPFLAEKMHLPPGVPPDALIFDEAAPITSKRRKVDSRTIPTSAVIPGPAGLAPSTASPIPGPLGVQGNVSEEERRIEELERAVQRETREHNLLVQEQTTLPAYTDGHPYN